MPTLKKRVHLSVADDLYSALVRLSKKKEQSVSSVSLALIEKAISLEEDFYFSQAGDERLSKKENLISHNEAWR